MSNNIYAIDIAKYWASICVIAVHVFTTAPINNTIVFVFINGISRLAVPFFFCCTGYFLDKKGFKNKKVIFLYVKKLLKIYLIWSLIYIPIEFLKMLGTNTLNYQHITQYLQRCLFQGTFVHLWYFPAVIFAVMFLYFAFKKMSIRSLCVFAVIIYIVGVLGDGYAGVMELLPQWVNNAMDIYKSVFIDTRNGLFFGVPYVLMGVVISRNQQKTEQFNFFPWLILSVMALCVETYLLGKFNLAIDYNLMLTLPLTTLFLFCLLLNIHVSRVNNKKWKNLNSYIYPFHLIPFGVILALLSVFNIRILQLKVIQFIIVWVCSHGFAALMIRGKINKHIG